MTLRRVARALLAVSALASVNVPSSGLTNNP